MKYEEYIYKTLDKITAEKLLKSQQENPLTALRVNLIKSNVDNFVDNFKGLKNHPFIKEAFYYDKSINNFGKHPFLHAGLYYIQDASAMMSATFLDLKKNEKVLDMCAAPGGKTSQIASYLNNTGLLLANDKSYSRCLKLSQNIERLGIKNTIVTCEESEKISLLFQGYFDKVLLDAPCSGQGMFRKNKEVKNDWTIEKTLSLAKIQKQLILEAYKCLKKGGLLVYSTCTFAVEENEEVVKFLLKNTKASLLKIEENPLFSRGIDLEETIRLYPFNFPGEGHFIALIKSNDSYTNKVSNHNKKANKKAIDLLKQFQKEYLNINLEGDFINMGKELHLLPSSCFSLNNLRILRNGLHLGSIEKNYFKPNHALAVALFKNESKNVVNLKANEQEIIDYLKGLTLTNVINKSYNLVCLDGISIGWIKSDGISGKNLLPKGLRILS